MFKATPAFFLPALAAAIVLGGATLEGQSSRLITSAIDEGKLVAVAHSTHPNARPEFDQGRAPDNLPMERMLLVLKRSAAQQAALDQFLDELQQPTSANYHKFLTPQEFGQRFGASDSDIQTIKTWLETSGFRVKQAEAGRGVIEFSGTAGQVRTSFHAEIHKFHVGGEDHWANASDQQIPAALAGAVAGVASLHNFAHARQSWLADQRIPISQPQFTSSSGAHALSPADYATIYNIQPLYPAITGAGVTIAVVGRSNINVQDVVSFRSLTGLPANTPNIVVNGINPGDLGGGEEAEAVLDTTWSGAVATGATVDLVVSASTATTDGADLSEIYIINNKVGSVMTESFSTCEAANSSATATLISNNAQQAAGEGITYMVSAGDAGSAGCDNFNTETMATGPLSVNLLASSPYTVAVGGSQFNETGGTYWASSNGSNYGSALSYIPEDVWNANCVGSACGTGSILAGGGGASIYFSKPSWQTGVTGIPSDGVRDLPDISLSAAGHDPYLLCLDGSCSGSSPYFYGIYGTSASAPSFAGIVALINQKAGGPQGQLTPRLYSLAATENLSNCNASNTASLPAATCIFNDITVGTNAVPGEANYNTSSETYPATVGYDLASGLGSPNVANLVNNWVAVVTGAPAAALSPTSLTFASQTDGTTSAAQILTLANGGNAALTVSGIAITGTNASDFAQTNTCGTSVAAGATCTISVTFTPSAAGSRSATLTVTDNAGNVTNATQGATLTGTGSAGPVPSTFTTYLAPYGSSTPPSLSGTPVVVPMRAYDPTGAAQINYMEAFLINPTTGSIDFEIVAQTDGAGGYTLRMTDLVHGVVPSPALEMSASGTTVTLTAPISIGTLQITAYRFALVGSEMQLDLTFTRTGSYDDEIVLQAYNGSVYSSPGFAVDGYWMSAAGSPAPAVTLSPTALNFGTQTVGTSASQTLTVTNSGNAALSISSVQVTGTNAADFTATNNCPASVAAGASCTINVAFDPASATALNATLSITDNAAGSPQAVPLSGTGSSAPTPTTFTTYLAPYGSTPPSLSGTSVVTPMRAYDPAGATQINYVEAFLVNPTTGSIDFEIVVQTDGAGGYTLRGTDLVHGVSPSPALEMSASGTTLTLTTPIPIGSMQITAYRFALAGNEMQIDLTLARSGTFNEGIVLQAYNGSVYSTPGFAIDGTWHNP